MTWSNKRLPWRLMPLAALCVSGVCARAEVPTADAVARANTSFAIDLYHQLASTPGNLFFSPYSLSNLLVMAYVGARGSTAAEMAAVLHLDQPPEQAAAGFKRLRDELDRNAITGVRLDTANSLWIAHESPLSDQYREVIQSQLGADARQVDFARHAAAARAAINSWVEAKTYLRLKELIGPGVLDARTRMVLCNAIYFKGRWAGPFDPAQTRPAPFLLPDAARVEVPTMHGTSKLRTLMTDGVRLLALP